MSKSVKNGTFIHGIAASEHIDSSGERILVKGIDISSLTKDGVFNWEHKNENSSQIVGKILEAKKILKKEDCETDAQRYFWDKIETPYIYVAGELFDHVGHSAAGDVAAMLKYDKNINKDETKALINFSIEGSRLGKEGSTITKCIARKVTVTITPCNKMAFAEQMDKKDTKKTMGGIDVAKDILDKFKKSEQIEIELMTKSAQKYMTSLAGGASKFPKPSAARDFKGVGSTAGEQREAKPIEPKRTFKPNAAPDKMKVGDRIDHTGGKPKAKTGHSIYNDPDTWKSEEKKKKKKKKISYESSMRKAIAAGAGVGAPSSLSGGSALAKEYVDGSKKKKKKKDESDDGMVQLCKFDVRKSLANDSWSRFVHKEQLVEIIAKRDSSLTKNEILAIAKSYAYRSEKKEEIALHSLMKKDKIAGGLADKKKPSDFDQKCLKQGIAVEMEHTSDKTVATEIAMDHLTEDPKYYDKLKVMESK